MDTKVKNIVALASVVLMISVAYAAVCFVNSYSQAIEPSSFRSFSVSGEGDAVAVPDVAQFSFSVLTEGGLDVGALQKQNAEKMNRAIDAIKALDVEKKDIATKQYSVSPRYTYYNCSNVRPLLEDGTPQPCPPPRIVGYTVQQSVEVKIRNFDIISDALAKVVESGANDVSQLFFTIDDPSALQDEARTEAIAKAQAKADKIARAAGFSVGRLLGIDEGGYSPIPYYSRSMEAMDFAGAPAVAPKIEAGSQEITVNVTLRYEIR